jgi:exopolyphosphatase / guanosine-5'-triphosphate,3'-diphosphate pyrophosphatase
VLPILHRLVTDRSPIPLPAIRWRRQTTGGMNVAVIDIGSNTVRLLVASAGKGDVPVPVCEHRRQVGLGDEIERRGDIGKSKVAETARWAAEYADQARRLRCERIDLVVTAPGRQSRNARELLARLASSSGVAPRVLSAEDEGRLAYAGAVAAARKLPNLVAVVDVGGGSTEIAFGSSRGDPDWVDSLDIGSLRLTRRFFEDERSSPSAVQAARVEVRRLLAEVEEPAPEGALATGGSARGLRRLVGRTLDADALERAIELMTGRTAAKIARKHGLELRRARTLLAGAIILAEVQAKLGVPLAVARGGMREGLAGELLAAKLAA